MRNGKVATPMPPETTLEVAEPAACTDAAPTAPAMSTKALVACTPAPAHRLTTRVKSILQLPLTVNAGAML
jgi:hypothetical protein